MHGHVVLPFSTGRRLRHKFLQSASTRCSDNDVPNLSFLRPRFSFYTLARALQASSDPYRQSTCLSVCPRATNFNAKYHEN